MSLAANLQEMERTREAYWRRYPATSPTRLRWRALTVRHCFHVLPGESVFELGAGSGIWTAHLARALKGENPITAAVFNDDLLAEAQRRCLPGARFIRVEDLATDFPPESFDYVVGTAILCHDLYPQNLGVIRRLLKPGGQFLFFEANYWNPLVLVKSTVPRIGRWSGQASRQVGLRKYKLLQMASHQGFSHIDITPYDIIHPRTPARFVRHLQSLAFMLEHAPGIRELCGTLYIWGRKPGREGGGSRPLPNLARHRELSDSTSVVVPCHNEEANIGPLVDALEAAYGPYIHEIILVDDNSQDRTAEVAADLARRNPRVKVVTRRPPNGVGRALRDGYAAASGRFILTMDCDFVQLVPELRDLFDAIAAGHSGAIGSRFSHDSILINYPFVKAVCNRAFHVLVRLFLVRVRDVSNNLKLYRSDILKTLDIVEPHFAANAETGLKPLLAGHDIVEVPVSWINRTTDMGSSSFRTVRVAPSYFMALVRMVWHAARRSRRPSRTSADKPAKPVQGSAS